MIGGDSKNEPLNESEKDLALSINLNVCLVMKRGACTDAGRH